MNRRTKSLAASFICTGALALVAATAPAAAAAPLAVKGTTAYAASVKWAGLMTKWNAAIPTDRYRVGQGRTALPAGTYVFSGVVLVMWRSGYTPAPNEYAVVHCSVGTTTQVVSGILQNTYLNATTPSISVPLNGTFTTSGPGQRLTIRCNYDLADAGTVSAYDGQAWAMRVDSLKP